MQLMKHVPQHHGFFGDGVHENWGSVKIQHNLFKPSSSITVQA